VKDNPNYTEESIQRVLYKLRIVREIKSFSQLETARALGMGLRSYQRLEAGELNCDLEFLLRFSKFFNVSFNELVSPEAPIKHPYQKIYLNENHLEFENIELIKKTNFIYLANQILSNEGNVEEKAKNIHFLNSPLKLYIFNSKKKIFNTSLTTQLDLVQSKCKTFKESQHLDSILRVIDNLQFYKPKYSIITPSFLIKSNSQNVLTCFNQHLHFDNKEIITLSLVESI
jgi:transcriptional regulator with XRE-family HTH domain